MQPMSTAPLTNHLHEMALTSKQDFTSHVQQVLLKQQGSAALELMLDGQKWHNVPGTDLISIRHIERHPDDRVIPPLDCQDCAAALPHISIFHFKKGVTGEFETSYNARISIVSGTFTANGQVVTAHNRALAEYAVEPGVTVDIHALEPCYVLVKYFPSHLETPVEEKGGSLDNPDRQEAAKKWFNLHFTGSTED
jgi:hypothetical protein